MTLTFAMTCAADVTFRSIVNEACLGDGAFRTFIDSMPSAEQAVAEVATALNAGNRGLADIEAEIVNGPYVPSSHWNAIAQTFDGGGSNDNDQAERLRNAATQSGSAKVRAYLTVFLTSDNEWRKSSGRQGRSAGSRSGLVTGVRPRGGHSWSAGGALARRR